jgi:hypothetical protein
MKIDDEEENREEDDYDEPPQNLTEKIYHLGKIIQNDEGVQ